MLEYIMKNKEWIFSGVGVLIISTIAALIWRMLVRKKPPTPHITVVQFPETHSEHQSVALQPALASAAPAIVTAAPITRIASISLSDIRKAIGSAPPLQQKQIAQNYEGIFVEWDAKLVTAEMKDKDTVWLFLGIGNMSTHMVHCTVKLSEYKELGIMPAGAPIRVIGRIKKVTDITLELEEVQLFFLQGASGASNESLEPTR